MASASCSGLLLSFLIVLLALGFSTADGYQGKIGTKRETGKEMSLMDSFDGPMVAAAHVKVRYFIGGRRMLQGLDDQKVFIPGRNNKPSDVKKSFQEPLHDPDHDHIDFRETIGTLKEEGNPKSDSEVPGVSSEANSNQENVVTKPDCNNDEGKAFLDAADEVANLMRKDYKGGDRPRRKPPINNHEPND